MKQPELLPKMEAVKVEADADTSAESTAKAATEANAETKPDAEPKDLPEKPKPEVSQLEPKPEPKPKPEHQYRSGTSKMGAPLATLTDPALLSSSPPRLPWLSATASSSEVKAASKAPEPSALEAIAVDEAASASLPPWGPVPALASVLESEPVPTFAPSTPSISATAPAPAPAPPA